MKYKFEKKFEKLFEDTIYRFQSGGFLAGDVVKFRANALSNEKVKGLSEQYQEMIKNAMNSDLNIRLSAVKSIRPNTAQNYDAYGTDAVADMFADVVVEHAPGCWQTPMTVPIEVLERVDTGINLAPVPDSLKRASQSTKPENVITNDPERTNTTKHTVLGNTKKPTDGRKGIGSPKPYKESASLEDVYGELLTEGKYMKNKNKPICKIDSIGTKEWFLNGKLHREDGPAIIYADGTKFWYLNGKLHREDGPAVEDVDGTKKWGLNNKLHREDGPAIEYANGTKEWYLNDVEYTKQEYYRELVRRGLCTKQEAFVEVL
jgi:hypothetical protein